jgi:hypothetical protein
MTKIATPPTNTDPLTDAQARALAHEFRWELDGALAAFAQTGRLTAHEATRRHTMTKKIRALLIETFASMSDEELAKVQHQCHLYIERYQAPSYTRQRKDANDHLDLISAELTRRSA